MYTRNNNNEICCNLCSKVVAPGKESTMHYHIKRQHQERLDHVCKYCDNYKTYQKSLLDQHIKNNHADKLILHTQSINMLKSYDCPFCPVKSTNKGNLKTHLARNHANWIEEYRPNKFCQHCGAGGKDNKAAKSATSYYYHCLTCVPATDNEVSEKIKLALK
jgi:hypothetical protein